MNIGHYLHKLNMADWAVVFTILVFGITQGLVYFEVVTQMELNWWFCLPQSISLFLERPWTIISYGFYHLRGQHLLWNMVFLFFSGHIFFQLFGSRQFVRVYLVSLIGGGFCFLLAGFFPIFGENKVVLLGASAAVMGVLSFVVSVKPSFRVYIFTFKVKLLYLLLFFILFEIIDIWVNTGGKMAHLGGIIGGIMAGLIYKYLRGKRERIIVRRIEEEEKKGKEMNEAERIRLHRVNQLLEKIGTSGYDSLSDEEKKYIFLATKEEI
nr:rhomboid family intramembrane serine protease [uncultured Capnocytophaga sp.]